MSNATPSTAAPCQPQHFRRHWWRAAVPAAFAVVMFGLAAYHVPNTLWIGVPSLCLLLLLCAALHGGLIVSREGIEWYILRPQWRYRAVPWDAVLDVRKSLFGWMRIRLIVTEGRYEPWVWGTPRPDRQVDIEIWANGFAGGEVLWDVIRQCWSSRARGAGVAVVDE